MLIPTCINLFGPAQTPGSFITDIAGSPKWVGAVLSGSTHFFPFSSGVREVERSRLLVLWAPRNTANYIQLVSCDSGPSNIVEIARIQSNGNMGPSVQAVDITAAFNSLVTAGVDKQIGFRVGGDGVNQWTLYEVQLELNFKFS